MQPRNLLTEWARLLLQSLASAGVGEAVISPGSRSTPFTVAALRTAELTCHSVIDERSAAFFALGMAKVTGRPSLLICTSGTAGAHYLPAVIEAAESRVPLLVLTADRPLELLDCHAPQTIDQAQLFGRHARWFVDLGAPDASEQAFLALRRKASQAALATKWPLAGCVHLNAHAAKPLEPVELAALSEPTPAERALGARVDALLAEPSPRAHVPRTKAAPEAVARLLERLRGCRRGLIVAGRRDLWKNRRPEGGRASSPYDHLALGPLLLAERSGLPLLAEAPSQLRLRVGSTEARLIDAIDSVVRVAWPSADAGGPTPEDSLELPDFVLELGPPLTSGAWAALARRLPPGVRHVVSESAWPDPHNHITELILGDPFEVAEELARGLGEPREGQRESLETASSAKQRETWSSFLRGVNQAAWHAVETAIEAMDAADAPLLEPAAVRAVVGALPSGALLALGNSLPIREVDWVCPRGSADVDVWVQRGANGIDGLIAGAAGAAHALGQPTCLLLGDVSLLHDLGSLAVARTTSVPLVIAVLDNGGGRIFDLLPFAEQAEQAGDDWRFWSTPPKIDLRAAATAFGLRYSCCRTVAEVRRETREALSTRAEQRATLLHLRVETGSAEAFARQLPDRTPRRLQP